MNFLLIVLFLSTVSFTHGKIFTHCELVKELSKHIPQDEVYIHFCATARDTSRQIAGYYGIYKINACGLHKAAEPCGIMCDKLIDEDIKDDAECAKLIFKSYNPKKVAEIEKRCEPKKKIVAGCLVNDKRQTFIDEDPSGDGGSGYFSRKSDTFNDDEVYDENEELYEDEEDETSGNFDDIGKTFIPTTPHTTLASNRSCNNTTARENSKTSCLTQPLNIMLMIIFGIIVTITVLFCMKINTIMTDNKNKNPQ